MKTAPREEIGPVVDAKAAAERLGYRSLHAFHQAYPRLGIRPFRLGRSLRFRVADLDAALRRADVVDDERKAS
jgi:hypothetical protein